MRSFEFCKHFPPLGSRSGAASDPRCARRLIENFAQEGGHPHNNYRGLPNNSYIEDFYRAIFFNKVEITHGIFRIILSIHNIKFLFSPINSVFFQNGRLTENSFLLKLIKKT